MDLALHLVTDLDGTWIPQADDLDSLRGIEAYLSGLHGFTLTFATGRTLASVQAGLSDIIRLWPTYLVTDVGCAIYVRSVTGAWEEDAEYARRVGRLWDAVAADRIARSLPPGIRLQPGVRPRRRLALEAMPGHSLPEATERLAVHLDKAHFPATILPSNDRCLDVLPQGVNKGLAVDYLEGKVRQPTLLMVCGDSENDLAMFHRADLAVLMADSPLQETAIDLDQDRLVRPSASGPAGILEVLRSLGIGGGTPLPAASDPLASPIAGRRGGSV